MLASHDLEDIVNVIANRTQILEEIAQSRADVRGYLADRCRELLAIPDFSDDLPGLVQDDSSGELTDRVLERLHAIAEPRA